MSHPALPRLLAAILAAALCACGTAAATEPLVITDIDDWDHSVKSVFADESVSLLRVELYKNKTYSVFYVSLPYRPARNEWWSYRRLAKCVAFANDYWNYTLVDEQLDFRIEVACDRAAEMVTRITYYYDGMRSRLDETQIGLLMKGLKDTVFWDGDIEPDVHMQLHYPGPVPIPIVLNICCDPPGCFRCYVIYNYHVAPVDLAELGALAPYGDEPYLPAEVCAQACEYDFNRDGRPELILALGNHLDELHLNVFAYDPPRAPSKDYFELCDQVKKAWKLVGVCEGQSVAEIAEDGAVIMPYGTKGLYREYRWKNGRMVES